MKQFIKSFLIVTLLLVTSSNNLFAKHLPQPLLSKIGQKAIVQAPVNFNFCDDCNDCDSYLFTYTTSTNFAYWESGLILDNGEEEVNTYNSKKNSVQPTALTFPNKLQHIARLTSKQSNTLEHNTLIFNSKKKTSLYLLFEVFRI